MSTPEGNFETAVDESSDADEREAAIDQLRTANECDMLAEIARMDDLDTEYRELALRNLSHEQCRPTLEELAEGSELPESLRDEATTLLAEMDDESDIGTSTGRN